MNYLAHAYLSKNDPELLLGNFIADHIRGNDFKNFSPGIIEGIYMHRRIDSFTDGHEEFKKVKRVFYEGFEKHSGILVDIYFDHLLARNFSDYSGEGIHEFSARVYAVYKANEHLLPESSSRFLNYVITHNIYPSYAQPEGLKRVLSHLSQRIRHNVQLDRSWVLFEQHKPSITLSFNSFFADAVAQFL